MLILDFQHVPSWFHCFLWHRRAYGKNGQILNFWTFQTKLYLSFSSGRDTSWQADRFQNVATIQLFCVTGTILWTCPSWFGVAGAALQACCCVFYANRIFKVASSDDNVQIVWHAWDILRVPFCVAGAAFGADLSCVECRVWQGQYIGTLYILHFALVTPHCTLNDTLRITARYNFHTLHLTLHTLYSTFFILHFTHHNPHIIPCTLHSPLSTSLSSHSTLCTQPRSALHNLHRYCLTGENVQNCWFFFKKNVWVRYLFLLTIRSYGFHIRFFAMMCSGLTPPNQRLFPTSLCGVLVFGCVLPAVPPLFPRNSLTHNVLTHNSHTHTHVTHTHNSHTHTTHTHKLPTHKAYTHTQFMHIQLTQNSYTHTTYSHTTRTHTHNLLTHNSHTHTT